MQTSMELERRAGENNLLIFVGPEREKEHTISCPGLGKTLDVCFLPCPIFRGQRGKKDSSFICISTCGFPGAVYWIERWAPKDTSTSSPLKL